MDLLPVLVFDFSKINYNVDACHNWQLEKKDGAVLDSL